MIKQGTIMNGRVKIVHTGTQFKVTLPDTPARSLEKIRSNISAHFWRGFWYACEDNCETADFHFAIALAYYEQSTVEIPVEPPPSTQRSGLHKYA